MDLSLYAQPVNACIILADIRRNEMGKKLNYTIGAATLLVLVGGTVYVVRKSIKARLDGEEIISSEEAVLEVQARKVRMEEFAMTTDEMDELVDDCRDEVDYNLSYLRPNMEHDDEDEEELDEQAASDEGHGFYDDVNFDVPLKDYMTEEDKVLRHEPNSMEALQQYMKMELAEWVPMEETYQTLLKLFNFPFVPQNDGDHLLMTKIIDYRVQFFGFNSRWVKEVSFAEIILYFAKSIDYNVGGGVRQWVGHILNYNDLDHLATSGKIDGVLERLNSHTYFNEHTGTYGLFGLNEQYINSAIEIAQRNVDKSLTYEIEFNELLKSFL